MNSIAKKSEDMSAKTFNKDIFVDAGLNIISKKRNAIDNFRNKSNKQ